MKIMHVTWGFTNGGTENLIVDLANEQSKSATVSVLIINDTITDSLLDALNNKAQVFKINRKRKTKNIIDQLKIIVSVLKFRPDILHLHHYGLYKRVQFVKLFRIPTCLTVHSTNYPCVDLDKHKHIFAISDTVRRDLFKKCQTESKTIYNGINVETIRAKTDTLWAETEPFRIVQVGRLLHTAKGQHILLVALRKLIDDFDFSNFTVDFIGTGESDEWLHNLVQKLQLQKHCHFLGEQSRATIYNNLENYHLLVQPSLWEGFGLTMIEAMATKVLVLASDIDAPKEITKNGKYGILFKNNNYSSLAQAMYRATEAYNQNSVQPIIHNAYLYAQKNFNTKTTANKYLEGYLA